MKSKYDDAKYLGYKSGKLTVVETGLRNNNYAGAVWRCKCSCNNNIKEYRASFIYNRYTKSCGCEKVNNKCSIFDSEEYLGKVFNDLKVISTEPVEQSGIHWSCKCIYCGNVTIRKAQDIVNGKTTRCRNKECIRLRGKTNIKYNNNSYIGMEYNLLNVKRYYIDKYKGHDSVYFECECLNCGNIVNFVASHVVNGSRLSCGCVHKSKHEIMLEKIFIEHNITYKREVSFDNLTGVGGGKLRFDFAIIDRKGNKKLIEYDGSHHFKEKFTTSTWNTERTLQNDSIKNKYCTDNNIELIRINKEFSNKNEMYNYLLNNNII